VVFGFGDGAPQLFSSSGVTGAGSYDVERGGANPLLGLASGGVYGAWSYRLSDRVQVSAGALARDEQRDARLLPALGVVGNGAEHYAAGATHVSLAYEPVAGLTLSGAYTRLHEGSALLGVQSFDPADFREGTTTDGYSVSVNWAATSNLSLTATGSVGRTRQGAGGASIAVGRDGLTATAFEVGLVRSSLFARGDRLQLSLAQPLYVERGRLDVTTVQVVDRATGAIGAVTQSFGVSGPRRLAAEAFYVRPFGRTADVSLFGRAETADEIGRASCRERVS
jgi:hypothetical protein